jgi:hypothetical protein
VNTLESTSFNGFIHWRMLILECSQGCYVVKIWPGDLDLWPWKSIGFQILLREYDTVARADNYFTEYRMLFLRRHSNEHDIFHGSCIDDPCKRSCSMFIRFNGVSQPSHAFNCSASVFSSTIPVFVSHPASIYLYNQFQGLRPSGLRLKRMWRLWYTVKSNEHWARTFARVSAVTYLFAVQL